MGAPTHENSKKNSKPLLDVEGKLVINGRDGFTVVALIVAAAVGLVRGFAFSGNVALAVW